MKKLVTVSVTNYYPMPNEGNYNPYDLNNPRYEEKIPQQEKEYLMSPEYFFLPLLAEREVEIIEVVDSPTASIKDESKAYQLFETWANLVIEEAKSENVYIDFRSLLENLLSSAFTHREAVSEKTKNLIESLLSPEEEVPITVLENVNIFSIGDEEIIFNQGNVVSFALEKNTKDSIQISLVNGYEYFLQGKEAINCLHNINRTCFLDAKKLLDLYYSESNYLFDFQVEK